MSAMVSLPNMCVYECNGVVAEYRTAAPLGAMHLMHRMHWMHSIKGIPSRAYHQGHTIKGIAIAPPAGRGAVFVCWRLVL